MKLKYLDECPKGLRYFDDDDLESKLKPKDIKNKCFLTKKCGSKLYFWATVGVAAKDIKAGSELTANYNLYTYPKTGVGLQMI